MQARNFCLNKPTSERFAKAKVVQESRTSTYLESQMGQSFVSEEELGMSIIDAMQTRDYSDRTCTCMHNCFDMWCLRKHPDQGKIYRIQMAKQARQDAKYEEQQVLLVGNNGDAEDASGKRIYKATPKVPRRQEDGGNKVVDEIIEEKDSSLSINSKSMSYVVDPRHSLNRDD